MAKPNYHHARRQKEMARKARQQEKQQRRGTREDLPADGTAPAPETAVPTEASTPAGK